MRAPIIAIVGAPGCGKSYLVEKLARHYKGKAILEGEEHGFPARILEDLRLRHRNLELFVWWRNKLVREMQQAQRAARQGKTVVMDNYWATNETYVVPFFRGFERELAHALCRTDERILHQPDLVIFLRASRAQTERMIRRRGRSYDDTKEFFAMARQVEREHAALFKRSPAPRLISLVRDRLDFSKPADMKKVTARIDAELAAASRRKPL